MKNKRNTSLGSIIIIIIIVLLIVLLIGFAMYFLNKFNQTSVAEPTNQQEQENDDIFIHEGLVNNINNNSNKIETLSDTVKYSSVKQQIKCYSIKLLKQKGREKEYDLDKDFKVDFKIALDDVSSLELIFNNSGNVIKDSLFFSDFPEDDQDAFTINLYRIGDYIAFTSHNATDIRSIHLFVINKQGQLCKDIYELDENNAGMVVDDIEFIDNSIIVNANRISHGPSIVYNGKTVIGKDLFSIPTNTPISAIYTYKLGIDGNVDFNSPTIVVKETMGDYINKNKSFIK